MFAKCHRDFAVDPDHTSYLIIVPYLTTTSWYKTYGKYYEHVKVYPKDTIQFSVQAEGTFNTNTLTPAGEHGGPGRVFVRETPRPVIVLYRNAFTVPKVDPVILAHFRFGHAQ
eukprot:70903-Prorocentrum_minimum.AAC.1